jgi:hypothetical protein
MRGPRQTVDVRGSLKRMQKIDNSEYQKRLAQLSEILEGIGRHVTELSKTRCPYKDRHDRCTAKFGCRNQRRGEGRVLLCVGDDKLDYRSAWESGG